MSTPTRNIGLRGTPMAVACVTAIGAALGAMYIMGRDVKQKEGLSSPYTEGGKPGGSDMKMTSSDVASVVSIPKPGKERISQSADSQK